MILKLLRCFPEFVGLPVQDEKTHRERATASISNTLTRLAKMHVLIIDDLLLDDPLSELDQHDLMEIVEYRGNPGSMVITSQYPLPDWYQRMGDPTLADAILLSQRGRIILMW